jgi:hypothetical protein
MTEINDLSSGGVAARAKAHAYIRDRLFANGVELKEGALTGIDLGDGSDEALDRIVTRLLLPELKKKLLAERAKEVDSLVDLDKRLAEGAGSSAVELDRRLGLLRRT